MENDDTMTHNVARIVAGYGHEDKCMSLWGFAGDCNCSHDRLVERAKRIMDGDDVDAAPEQADANVTETERPRWYLRSDGWTYHAENCGAYDSEILVCDCGLDEYHTARGEGKGKGRTYLEQRHSTQLNIDLRSVTQERNRLRADLEAEREVLAATRRALDLSEKTHEAERKHADGLADVLSKVEWIPGDRRNWCPWCLSLHNEQHEDDCERKLVLRAHDARRVDGGKA